MRVPTAVVLCTYVLSVARASHPILELPVEVRLVTKTIYQGDILFAKVSVSNPTDEPVVCTSEFTFEASTLAFQVRSLNRGEFKRIGTVLGGLSAGLRETELIQMGPNGESHALAAVIANERVFPAPGDYEIRAVICDQAGFRGASAPTIVHILAPPERESDRKGASSLVSNGIPFGGIPIRFSADDFKKAAANVEVSELRTAAHWLGAICSIRDAKTKESFSHAVAQLEEQRKHLHPITQDWVARVAAQQYIAIGRYDLAQNEIETLSDTFPLKRTLIGLCAERMRNAELKSTAP